MVKEKKKIIKKINFLVDFAISEKNNNNPYIYDYIKIAFDLAKKINYRISKDIHRKVCKKCFSIRTTDNTKIRTERLTVNGKIKKQLKLHCLSCNFIKKISL